MIDFHGIFIFLFNLKSQISFRTLDIFLISPFLQLELTEANSTNFQLMIQRIVYAEFDVNRNNQSNLAVIQFFIQNTPRTRDATAKELARVFHFILVTNLTQLRIENLFRITFIFSDKNL